jgi:uncharacterized delta-60 repeat protein
LRVSRLPVDVEAVRMLVPVRQPRARRWLLAVAGLLAWQLVAAVPATALPGQLDPGFGRDGKVTTDFAGHAGANAAVVQDGRLVAAGFGMAGSSVDFALARYRRDGTLDRTFGTGGKVTTDFAGSGEQVTALVVQADGKLVAAGFTATDSGGDFALARYRRDGTLDPSFGTGGKVTTDFAGGADGAAALVVQADGKLVAAGSATSGTGLDVALARYRRDGTLDPTFGTGGKVITDIAGGFDEARALVMQDGRLVVAGFTFTGEVASGDFALARYRNNGSLDPTFGTGGKVVTDIAGAFDEADALVVQDDTLVAGGTAFTGSTADFALARYRHNGSLDPTFGTGGKVTTGFADVLGGDELVNALVVRDGKLVAAGFAFTGSSFDFGLARYRHNGALDATFGAGGKVTTDFAGGEDRAETLVVRDGKLVAAGSTITASGGQKFALARYR